MEEELTPTPTPEPAVTPMPEPTESTLPQYIAPEYLDIETLDGKLRIIHEMTTGDLLIVTFLGLVLLFLILDSLMKIVWRR